MKWLPAGAAVPLSGKQKKRAAPDRSPRNDNVRWRFSAAGTGIAGVVARLAVTDVDDLTVGL